VEEAWKMKRTDKQLKTTAYHEAGHAVFAWYKGIKIKRVTIIPDADSAGHVHHAKVIKGRSPELDNSARNRVRMENQIMISLAGLIAQRIWNPRTCRTYQCRSDHQTAVDVAMTYCGSGKQATAFLRYLHVCVDEFLRSPGIWRRVQGLAVELLRRNTMTGEEVDTFLLDFR
jgi:hypothetical protein